MAITKDQLAKQVQDTYAKWIATWKTSATHSSLDSDWITLNFDFSDEDCYLVITCFW